MPIAFSSCFFLVFQRITVSPRLGEFHGLQPPTAAAGLLASGDAAGAAEQTGSPMGHGCDLDMVLSLSLSCVKIVSRQRITHARMIQCVVNWHR